LIDWAFAAVILLFLLLMIVALVILGAPLPWEA